MPFFLIVVLLLLPAFRAEAQPGGEGKPGPGVPDSTSRVDTLFSDPDDLLQDSVDQSIFDEEFEDVMPESEQESSGAGAWSDRFSRGVGLFGGPTFELMSLDPSTLDPDFSGSPVIFGGYGVLVINGLLLGGGGYGVSVYDLSEGYDEFSFGYGGALLGYIRSFGMVTLQTDLLLGTGGLNMYKSRPDLAPDSDQVLFERFREEHFFVARPGISLGFSPFRTAFGGEFPSLRFSASYLYTLGDEDAADLRSWTYGIHVMFGGIGAF